MTIPRTKEYVEPSVFAIGVGGAATGWHFNVHVHDDLVTDNAADSPTVMETAIQWFKDSRALLDDQQYSLEYTVGTHWAVHDLYYVIMNDFDGHRHPDPTVEWRIRSIIEDGMIVFPEMGYNWENIIQLQAADPVRFALMYMNSLADPSIADFNAHEVREYDWLDDCVSFNTDDRDAVLVRAYGAEARMPDPARHGPVTLDEFHKRLAQYGHDGVPGGRDEWMARQYGTIGFK